jgi:hypothetical protein
MNNNVYLYWTGPDIKLIKILRKLIYLHSKSGNGYNVHLINHENLHKYLDNIPSFFYNLRPAFQADYVRVFVICEYGGIWLDSDTLVLESLDSLFDKLNKTDGFLVNERDEINNTNSLCNGIFGSKAKTELMLEWKDNLIEVINIKKENILWCDLGSKILNDIYCKKPELFSNYEIINGVDNIYPIPWYSSAEEYIYKPFQNYINILRNYQPLLILVNHVYHAVEHLTEEQILNSYMPINYFINKSLENGKNNEATEKI